MGRRKISIQPITDERNRKVTFVKRKAGLFKKAHELAVLCQVDLAVVILGNNGSKFYEYSSVDIKSLIGSFEDPKILHDSKVPSDYGDYELKSRIKGDAFNRSHNRNASSISLSIDESNDEDEDDDEDDNDEDEDADEDETVPPMKKRRTTRKPEPKKKSSKVTPKEEVIKAGPQFQQPAQPTQEQLQQAQQHAHQLAQQQMQQLASQRQQPPVQNTQAHPTFISQGLQQIPQAMYAPGQGVPPQYQQMRSTLQQDRVLHPQMPIDGNTVPVSHPPQGSFTNSVPGNVNQYQFPSFQFAPGTPMSSHSQDLQSVSTPVVANSKDSNSPYATSRARSLNNNISSRPVLSLKIPGDVPQTQAGGSAMTVTAIETSQNDAKPSTGEEKTPSSAEREGSSADGTKNQGLGISSNKSTPISASLPSGLFSLPLPQPNQHQFSSQPAFKLMAGEQTPLTGGLPSKYVPDLFPSPSNFYSNEWNIPFGSGNTPYPNSAVPGGGQQLPNISSVSNSGPGNGANGRLKKQFAHLNNDAIDSPLQNMSKGGGGRKGSKELPSKKIKFEGNEGADAEAEEKG